jgi:hypothetical protein
MCRHLCKETPAQQFGFEHAARDAVLQPAGRLKSTDTDTDT